MPTSNWKSAAFRAGLKTLDRAGFALEFLRRNPDYRRDHNRAQQRRAENRLTLRQRRAELAERWGLDFRSRP